MGQARHELVACSKRRELPERAYFWARKRVVTRTTGSILGAEGSLVGMSIDQLLLKQEPITTR